MKWLDMCESIYHFKGETRQNPICLGTGGRLLRINCTPCVCHPVGNRPLYEGNRV